MTLIDPWLAPPPRSHTTRPLPPDVEVVTRRINVATERLSAALIDPALIDALQRMELGDDGWLGIDEPLTAVDAAGTTWRGRGRLYGRGLRLARYARVEIEISAWSTDASQLWLRPTCRHPLRWGVRRLRRYFALAQLAGDNLWRTFTDAGHAQAIEGNEWCEPITTAA